MKCSVAVYLLKRFIKLRKLIYEFKAQNTRPSLLHVCPGITPHFTANYIFCRFFVSGRRTEETFFEPNELLNESSNPPLLTSRHHEQHHHHQYYQQPLFVFLGE